MQPHRRKRIKVRIYPLNAEQCVCVYVYFPAKASICKNIISVSNCEKESVQRN